MSFRITGKLPEGKHRETVQRSPHYRNGAFRNLSPTPIRAEGVSYWKMMQEFFKKHPETEPRYPLPSVKTNLEELKQDEPVLVWFGHSSYFLRIAGKNFLVDPVFSGNAAPFSFMVKAFPGSNIYGPDDMPFIDYLILTHDHYDHLDYHTLRRLINKTGAVICSLGLRSHLEYWGYEGSFITELDWWQLHALDPEISLTAAPARHFSGRGFKRGQTLWSSFILKTPKHKIYLGGDSGYDSHFGEIGMRSGPFDLAILESGQYNKMWPLIHMMPEEAVQAAADLQARALMPVHWGKFRLSMHPWNEPVKRVIQKAAEKNIPVLAPRIGEPVLLNNTVINTAWWEL